MAEANDGTNTPGSPSPPQATPKTAPAAQPNPAPPGPPSPPAAAPPPVLTIWQKTWPYCGMALLIIVFTALAVFLYKYAIAIGFTRLGTIEGTRPLLVIAAIMSTIAFGGALLFGSIFSSEGTFEERFRHAREIFLVFSGVFGTVIGFYFGAGETKAPGLVLGADVQESAVVAYVSGGTPPYKVTVTYGPQAKTKTAETKTGWARFSFNKDTDNISQLQVSAIDSKAVQAATPVTVEVDKMKSQGWKLP